MILRAVYYFWVVLFFPIIFFAFPGFDLSLETPALFIFVLLVNAVVMGWLGDAIIFGRGTIFGKAVSNAVVKWCFVAVVVLAPILVMGSGIGTEVDAMAPPSNSISE